MIVKTYKQNQRNDLFKLMGTVLLKIFLLHTFFIDFIDFKIAFNNFLRILLDNANRHVIIRPVEKFGKSFKLY